MVNFTYPCVSKCSLQRLSSQCPITPIGSSISLSSSPASLLYVPSFPFLFPSASPSPSLVAVFSPPDQSVHRSSRSALSPVPVFHQSSLPVPVTSLLSALFHSGELERSHGTPISPGSETSHRGFLRFCVFPIFDRFGCISAGDERSNHLGSKEATARFVRALWFLMALEALLTHLTLLILPLTQYFLSFLSLLLSPFT